jgi:glycosyltransferase involved in cell wall biosynthesis
MLVPALPPRLDGIGDYSATVASGLAEQFEVSIIVRNQMPPPLPISGVQSIMQFGNRSPKDLLEICDQVQKLGADGLLVQYNPFSYGRRGLNPWLPVALKRIASNGTRIGVMAHETYVVSGSPLWRLIGRLQRLQLAAIAKTARITYTSCERYREHVLAVASKSTVRVMPIGSNIPRVPANRKVQKERLGIPADTTVLGLFGTTGSGVQPEFIAEVLRRSATSVRSALLLYVGSQGDALRAVIPPAQFLDLGRLDPTDVSLALTAMDIYLATFDDGISTRRGTVMAALQHGIALVGTSGKNTDALWQSDAGDSLLLAPADSADAYAAVAESLISDPARTEHIGKAGASLYDRLFEWRHTIAATTSFME